MILSASIELQKALYAKLSAGSYAVYDEVPVDAPMPFIVIGEETLTDSSTKVEKITRHLVMIHCFSSYAGMREVKEMMDFVSRQLEAHDYALTGYTVEYVSLEMMHVVKENDPHGATIRHGVVQYKFLVQEV